MARLIHLLNGDDVGQTWDSSEASCGDPPCSDQKWGWRGLACRAGATALGMREAPALRVGEGGLGACSRAFGRLPLSCPIERSHWQRLVAGGARVRVVSSDPGVDVTDLVLEELSTLSIPFRSNGRWSS